jgi:bifunctional ADP-heptose synthase (sugar kinase/adenylyltransferase)
VVGGDFVRSYGGQVVTLTYVEGVSTTGILRKIKDVGMTSESP